VARAVEDTLRGSPAIPDRTRLLRAAVDGQAVSVDLSREILDWGTGWEMEEALRQVLDAAAAAAGLAERDVDFHVSVEGRPLDRVLEAVERREGLPREATGPDTVASAARRVALSPGHGYFRRTSQSQWQLQRPLVLGLQEDFVNAELVMLLHASLRSAGFDSYAARELDKARGMGESGKPRWQEAASPYLKSIGYPASIWGTLADGEDADIRSRPLFANAVSAEALLSLHNNAGGGTGTEIWVDSSNGSKTESTRFARAIEEKLIGRIRREWSASWRNRGLKTCNGCKGENRLATRAAVIVELAFMDQATPDSAALKSEGFRRIAVAGMHEGVEAFLAASPSPSPSPTPYPTPQPAPTPRPSAPRISSVSPTSVLGGEFSMTILGTGFDAGAVAQVYQANGVFMGTAAVSSRSSTRLVVRPSMAGAAPTSYGVRVRNANGEQSNSVSFSLYARVSVGPASGASGTLFSYSGEGFTGSYGVTSHLRRPNGTEFPTLQIPTDGRGRFSHTVNSAGFAPGVYELWAVDNNTRHVTSRVAFRVQ
jgi:N-acetylmuramoyl-L-alanine amidase